MVRVVRRLLVAVALVGGLSIIAGPAAFADWGSTTSAPVKPYVDPSATNTATGDPVHKAVRNCSLYATSSSFGLSCFSGSENVKTVKDILGDLKKNPPDFCWDELIPAGDLQPLYGYAENPDSPYYMHSCITGLDLSSSPHYQPNMILSQQVIEIANDATDCKGDRPYPGTMMTECIMTLTANQQQIVNEIDSNAGQIPGIIITKHPSTKVRTNETVAYTDDADGGITRTANYHVGAVTMWAQMTKFSIHPYGPNGISKTCNGTADVSNTDTPQTKPDACWWTYDASSAGRPGEVYPFRAEADWTVYYDAGAGPQVLKSFQKFSDLQLPVYDIQTLVID